MLGGAGLGEVEAGPGVEDERTEGRAVERPAGPGGHHQYRHDTDFLLNQILSYQILIEMHK